MTFEIGQRIKLSSDGIRCLWQTKSDRSKFRGTVIRESKSWSCYIVKWDHLMTERTISDGYLTASINETIDAAGGQST